MARYVLIDEHSGYVWGDCWADSPIAACREIDENLGASGREYEDIGRALFNGRPGYWVHEVPDWFRVEDGQDENKIRDVIAMPLATCVVTHTPID